MKESLKDILYLSHIVLFGTLLSNSMLELKLNFCIHTSIFLIQISKSQDEYNGLPLKTEIVK